jgi:hypothetical protein
MNISAPFIKRPVGTSLLTIALALAGRLGYWRWLIRLQGDCGLLSFGGLVIADQKSIT